MKIRCTKDPEHDRFMVRLAAIQTWEVEKDGTLIRHHKGEDSLVDPDNADIYCCAICNSDAVCK